MSRKTLNTTETTTEKVLFNSVCEYIKAHHEESLSLEKLSELVQLSPGYFQRRFKTVVGVTPKQYQEAYRIQQLKQHLQKGTQVTQAIYEAGFNTTSRVYEKLDQHLGMTPNQYRKGGKGLSISYVSVETDLGLMILGATDRGLCYLQFGKSSIELLTGLKQEYPNATLTSMDNTHQDQFDEWIKALEEHLRGNNPNLNLPLDIQGTDFQLKVWHYLQKIPYGEVQSYKQVAQGIGHPNAVRATATACAANRLAIVIPCHRVIRGNGSLGGYRWGLKIKQHLLEQEQASNSVTQPLL